MFFVFFVSFSIKIFIYLTKYGYYKHINQIYEYMRKGNLQKKSSSQCHSSHNYSGILIHSYYFLDLLINVYLVKFIIHSRRTCRVGQIFQQSRN